MNLEFHKEKQKIAALSDAALIARLRDPNASATDRMLAEAELSRRGLDRRHEPPQQQPESAPQRSGVSLFSILIFLVIAGSIIAGLLEDMGIDVVEWLRRFFDEHASQLRLN